MKIVWSIVKVVTVTLIVLAAELLRTVSRIEKTQRSVVFCLAFGLALKKKEATMEVPSKYIEQGYTSSKIFCMRSRTTSRP